MRVVLKSDLRCSLALATLGLPGNSPTKTTMTPTSDDTMILDRNKTLADILKKRYGASGAGLGQLTRGVEHKIPRTAALGLYEIAEIRNKKLKDREEFPISIGKHGKKVSRKEFEQLCDEVERLLTASPQQNTLPLETKPHNVLPRFDGLYKFFCNRYNDPEYDSSSYIRFYPNGVAKIVDIGLDDVIEFEEHKKQVTWFRSTSWYAKHHIKTGTYEVVGDRIDVSFPNSEVEQKITEQKTERYFGRVKADCLEVVGKKIDSGFITKDALMEIRLSFVPMFFQDDD